MTHTYQSGQRVSLRKAPDAFVVRLLPAEAKAAGLVDSVQVSSASSRVRVSRSGLESVMTSARKLAPAHHAYVDEATGAPFLITDRVLVRFREALDTAAMRAFAERYALVHLEAYSAQDHLYRLSDATGMNPVKLVVLLQESDPVVELAEHDLNHPVRRASVVPKDPAYKRQWHLHLRSANASFDPRASARCEQAWRLLGHHGSAEVVVGVSDDGCDLSHEDFDGPTKLAGWGYFEGSKLWRHFTEGADPSRMRESGADHGTNCCGVVAAEADARHTVGAAPGCALLPVKWESSGDSLHVSDSKILTLLAFVSKRVDVLSCSWSSSPAARYSEQVVRRIRELSKTGGRRGKGMLFVWAAGNDNCPLAHEGQVDIPYTSGWHWGDDDAWHWVGVETSRAFMNTLARLPGVLHVAAISSTAQRAHYSNYGVGVDLCAPSSNSHTYDRMPVPGLAITTTSGEGDPVAHDFGGTSSATPLVAGVAALVISANPELGALEVASILKRTASRDLDHTGYARTPPSDDDPDTSWDVSPAPPFEHGAFRAIGVAEGTWSPWFGFGRVDAEAAVREALGEG